MDWYYSQNNQQQGPVSREKLEELIRDGAVKSFDLVWNESLSEWTPLGKLPEFAPPPEPVAETPPAMSPAPADPASPLPAPAAAPVLLPSGATEPPTYLWQSIVVLLLCCWPLAIPAIVFATRVKPAFAAGDYAAALDNSKKAKTWCLVSLIVGFVVQTIIFIISFAAGFSQSYSG